MTAGRLTNFKNRLATIKPGSFRYQMTSGIYNRHNFESSYRPTRACSFYWWYMPTSALVWSVIGIAFFAWSIVTYLLIIPLGWILGFTPDREVLSITEPESWGWHGGYGYNPITKKRHLVAYQHVLLFIAALVVLVTLRGHILWWIVIDWTGVVLGAFLVFTSVGYIFTRKAVKEAWHRICPELKIVEENK